MSLAKHNSTMDNAMTLVSSLFNFIQECAYTQYSHHGVAFLSIPFSTTVLMVICGVHSMASVQDLHAKKVSCSLVSQVNFPYISYDCRGASLCCMTSVFTLSHYA